MKYVVPSNTNKIDGIALGIKPGDGIVVDSKNQYSQPLHFSNLSGVNIVTEGRVDLSVGTGFAYVVKFTNCNKFKLSGDFHLSGGNKDSIGITCESKTTEFEIEGVEIFNTGFAGIMAKDNLSKRGEFTMKDVKIHHCLIRDTGGEGLYIGNSSPSGHDLENISIYANKIVKTGWDGLQLGCCVKGGLVYDNVIEDAGTKRTIYQNNGIQIGERTKALVYNNVVKRSSGNGIIILGSGVHAYRNRIFSAGENGIYADDRADTTEGFKFTDNLIVSPASYCMTIEANKGLINEVRDSILLNPGQSAPLANKFINRGSTVIVKENNNVCRVDFELANYFVNKI